jgi:hypothetical protein
MDNMDSQDVRVTVTNVDEDGSVTLDSDQPVVGTAITATLDDPDGDVTGETWQWASSSDMASWADIAAGADSDAYTPTADDAGMYLRATASYDDGVGAADTAMETTANAVSATATPTAPTTGSEVGDIYDTNDDGEISRVEAIGAIQAYFRGEISRVDVIKVIQLFFAAQTQN